MKRQLLAVVFAVVGCAWFASTARAGAATELAEWMAKQGSRYADDLAGQGVKGVARELEELAAKTSDDVVEQLVTKGGPGALRAVRGLGDATPDAARIIARLGEPGKLAVEQGGKAAVVTFREFGDDGLRLLISQGTAKGEKLLATYGSSLAENAGRMSPESLTHLRQWVPEVEKAPPAWRQAFLDKLKQGGDDFVQWTAKRWKAVAVTGGLSIAAITAYHVGDGIVQALPNPSKDPVGWIIWWMPILALAAILTGGLALRGRWRATA